MGLAASQVRLLTLTARKADCEYGLTIDSMHKMDLTMEMAELSSEYNSKLRSKKLAFYANNQYNQINYAYLMGYGSNYMAVLEGNRPLKEQNSMILTDYKGAVVLEDSYAKAILSVIGNSAMDSSGRGSTFSSNQIAAIIANLCPGLDKENIQNSIDKKSAKDSSYTTSGVNTLTGESTGTSSTQNNTDAVTSQYDTLVDFYYPILIAAATNGWTTEYNKEMQNNDDYVNDALLTGSFQLATVGDGGQYEEDTSLMFYLTAGYVQQFSDSEEREEVTAWYNAEKERITQKETLIDLHMTDLNTELEAINTEIQSIQSLIDDAIGSVFDWGGN